MYIHHVFSQVFFTEFPQGSTIFSALVAMIPATCPAMAVAMLAGSCAAVCATARRRGAATSWTWDLPGIQWALYQMSMGFIDYHLVI